MLNLFLFNVIYKRKFRFIIASFNYKNKAFIFINEACNYRLVLCKNHFVIREKEVSIGRKTTFLLIDDRGKSSQCDINE